jgi:hypothetical protein
MCAFRQVTISIFHKPGLTVTIKNKPRFCG